MAVEMAQQIKLVSASPEDLDYVPSNSCVKGKNWVPNFVLWPSLTHRGAYVYALRRILLHVSYKQVQNVV